MERVLLQVRALHRLEPANNDHLAAFRVAPSVAVPSLLLLAMGRSDLMIYAVFGALTGMYGRSEPHRFRLWHQGRRRPAGRCGGGRVPVRQPPSFLVAGWGGGCPRRRRIHLRGPRAAQAQRTVLWDPRAGGLRLGAHRGSVAGGHAHRRRIRRVLHAGGLRRLDPPQVLAARCRPGCSGPGPRREARDAGACFPVCPGRGCGRHCGRPDGQRPSALGHGRRRAAGRGRSSRLRPAGHPPHRGDVRGTGGHRRRYSSGAVVPASSRAGRPWCWRSW